MCNNSKKITHNNLTPHHSLLMPSLITIHLLCCMRKMWVYTLLFICTVAAKETIAQNSPLDGNWYSNGTVIIEGSTNSYLGELKLKQKGREIKGQFNYYFRDSLFTNNVEGVIDMGSRYVIIKPFPIILHSSTSTKTGVDCSMTGEFMLRISRVGSYLAGKFVAEPKYKYTCPEIAFDFEKNNDSITPIEEAKQATIVAKATDTAAIARDPVAEIIKQQFDERPKDYFKQVEVESKTIKIELYDNGAIDYDSISVFLNNKLILKETMLSHAAIRLTLQLDDSLPYNELGVFANNEGLIPPNTSTLILLDGDNRQEIEIYSSLHRTATVRMTKRKQ